MKLQNKLFANIFLFLLLIVGNSYSQAINVESPIEKGPNGFLVNCKVSHIISAPGNTPFIKMTALIPQSIPDIQKIHSVEFSIEPSRYFKRGDNKYAEIIINNPNRIEKIEVTIHAELFKYDLLTAQQNKNKGSLERKDLLEYLKDEKYIEKDKKQNDFNLNYDKIFNSKKCKELIKKVRKILCVKAGSCTVSFDYFLNEDEVYILECLPDNRQKLLSDFKKQMTPLKKEFKDFLVKENCEEFFDYFWDSLVNESID